MTTNTLQPLDRFALRWHDRIRQHPWLVIATVLALVAIAATGIPKLGFSSNFRVYFSPTNPELLAFEELQATFNKNDNILFVVKPPGGEVFTNQALDVIEKMTEEAWQLPYVSRVDSITNFQHTYAADDELIVVDLVRGAAELTPEELAEKRAIALAEPLLNGSLLSPDASTTGINLILQFPEKSLAEVPEAVAEARALARRVESETPGTQVAITGVSVLNYTFTESGMRDGRTLMPLMFAMLTVLMVISLRSVLATLATLTVVALSTTVAMGLAGHLGIILSPVAVNAPTIIMTLAVADSVHLLTTMLVAMRDGMDKSEALRESLRINFLPVIITSVTTMFGFLTLNFSDTPPFHALGNITAIGIVACLIISLTVLPALLVLMPIRVRLRAGTGDAFAERLDRLGAWIARHHRAVLVSSLAVIAVLVSLLPRIDLNDQWVRYFDERVEFRRDADFADQHLTGLYPIDLTVPAGEAEGISDPEYLETLDRLTKWLRQQPETRHVFSYSDIVKRLNMNLNADSPEHYRIPSERNLAAQYLLTYELSLPFGLDLNDRISVDKSATRVTAALGDVTTRVTRDFLKRVDQWFVDNAPPRMRAVASGAPVMFSYISERNIKSMLLGNLIAVVLIAGILMLSLRSFGLGLLSLIPNIVPVLMTFGLWAVLVGKVGMASAMVSVVALGIIVDDTVHFLVKYQLARRERDMDRAQAIRYAFRTVGSAIVATTAILTAGFLMLALSTFRINFELGLLTAMAIVMALLADGFLLPSLLLWGYRADPSEETVSHDPAPQQS